MQRKAITLVVSLIICSVGVLLYSLNKPSSLLAGLPSATKTANGHSGDPLNVVIIGDKTQLNNAFHTAHWLVPDPVSETTAIAIVKASVLNESYPSAPVSRLYLFGRPQDQAFEFPTESVRQRHHVRLWLTTRLFAGKEMWIGSATYDSGIELSATNHLPTHHISANVDAERTFLTKSMDAASRVPSLRLERLTHPTLWQTNGGGDWYFNDGNVEIIQLK